MSEATSTVDAPDNPAQDALTDDQIESVLRDATACLDEPSSTDSGEKNTFLGEGMAADLQGQESRTTDAAAAATAADSIVDAPDIAVPSDVIDGVPDAGDTPIAAEEAQSTIKEVDTSTEKVSPTAASETAAPPSPSESTEVEPQKEQAPSLSHAKAEPEADLSETRAESSSLAGEVLLVIASIPINAVVVFFAILDKPFCWLSMGVKQILGYIAIVTLAVATTTWFLHDFVHGR